MHILHVVGARPNFMKAAPVLHALRRYSSVRQSLVHTGQHYDSNMSDAFFIQLEIPAPDVNLGVGSGTHACQTAEVMSRFEQVVLSHAPDIVVVYGDVNSTLAATLVCSKLGITVAHVEAGLRSYDRTMPEEINRLVTDRLADLLFTPSADGDENLEREGVPMANVHCVGNVMIDSLVKLLPLAKKHAQHSPPGRYALVTLHRPSNVDDVGVLTDILTTLAEINDDLEIVFPVHPRTRERILAHQINLKKLNLVDPLPYIEFLSLQSNATAIITDSGGIQEESTYLGVPCLTMRNNTERPVTVTMGTNTLVGQNPARLTVELRKILEGNAKKGTIPPLWDGHAGKRIAEILVQADLNSKRQQNKGQGPPVFVENRR